MGQRDYLSYRQLFEAIAPYVTKPDLLIYMKASVDTLVERFACAAATGETGIALDYLAHLNDRYADWMDHFDLCPVLILDADRLDFVQRDRDLRFVYDQVSGFGWRTDSQDLPARAHLMPVSRLRVHPPTSANGALFVP